ncbi:MAG TPA: hypothetical protein VG649_24470, partial [Candidatus Angelobacter sp.]|nr:hypothetical protein [Candidatus Angelobacter sp.]
MNVIKKIQPLPFMLLLVLFVACGTPGAPQPPSLNIPKPITDLAAVRKGDTVTLSWTAPEETTDGTSVRHSGRMIVRRTVSDGGAAKVVGEVPLVLAHKTQEAPVKSLKDSVGDLVTSASVDFVRYTVEAVNNSGKSAGQSNQAVVPLVLTPVPPKDIQVKPVPQGVSISWQQNWLPKKHTSLSTQYVYRIMRRAGSNQRPVMVKQLSAGGESTLVIDTGIEWEKQYQYWVIPVTLWQKDEQEKGEVEGDDSTIVTLTTLDKFPPAVPSGLQAVFTQAGQKSFIDLSWTASMDSDLAGYNVYRS